MPPSASYCTKVTSAHERRLEHVLGAGAVKCLEHDRIYSGATTLDRKFQCICRKCGDLSATESYDLAAVDQQQYLALRVLHGWDTPRKLPGPPRMPVIVEREPETDDRFVLPMVFFAGLFVACGLMGIPWFAFWGITETILPRWLSLVSSGMALLTTTICYIAWKRKIP